MSKLAQSLNILVASLLIVSTQPWTVLQWQFWAYIVPVCLLAAPLVRKFPIFTEK